MEFDENLIFVKISEEVFNQRMRELDCVYRKQLKNGDWKLLTGERISYLWDYDKDCARVRIRIHCSAMKEFSEFLYYYLYEIAVDPLINYLIVYSDIKNKLVNKYRFNRY